MDLGNISEIFEQLVPTLYSNVVAVESVDNEFAEIFTRKNDLVKSEKIKFEPFILLTRQQLLQDFNETATILNLSGNNTFSSIAKFPSISIYEKALFFLKKQTGFSPSSTGAPYKVISDLQQQIFISLRLRLFRGMNFGNLRRMQIDIETLTTEGYDFPNAEREGDSIIIISMSDNTGWEECLVSDGKNKTEKDIINEFVKICNDRDPDVIEGHNLFRFDLPFIFARAKRHKIKIAIGRDGSLPLIRSSRFTAAERTTNYKRVEIYGRHVIDTYFLAMLYDVSHRSLESLGLKSIALHFKVASENRTYIDASKILEYFESEREKLISYALDDVRETRAISEIFSPSYFYQAQLQPFSYQNITVRGNATRIDAMLTASYIDSMASIPIPLQMKEIGGGLTEAVSTGVFDDVWHCDIRSLYPSIMVVENINPKRDYLNKFTFFLSKLRDVRIKVKKMEQNALTTEERDLCNSLQTSFKIMINSFYGYLGFSQGTFNDPEMADKVTSKGRELLKTMEQFIVKSNYNVIEMDTDGIYFQPIKSDISPKEFEKQLQRVLPDGIDVELDATYKRMFSYKSKNYALLTEDNEVILAGAALKSRGVEPFIREYLKSFIILLLNGDYEKIDEMTQNLKNEIADSKISLSKLTKTETLKDSLDLYKTKRQNGGKRNAAYELAAASGRVYSAGDQVSYYVTGNKKKVSVVDNSKLLPKNPLERDENTLYYISKIDELYSKFAPYIPMRKPFDQPFCLE